MGARDLTGKRFGRLVVLYRDKDNVSPSGYKSVMWRCKCDCGNEITVRAKSLVNGMTKSCGCFRREEMARKASKHNGFGTRLYHIWDSMRQRCNNPRNNAYCNYGGRGIKICKEWDNFSNFREWALQTGYDETAPRGKFTIDRIDVNGDYSPNNCRWADMKEQTKNRRESIYLVYNGQRKTLMEWCQLLDIKYQTAWRRYSRGLPVELILKDKLNK